MNTTTQTAQTQARQMCDVTLNEAVQHMLANGATLAMVLDRLMTFSIAHAVKTDGALHTGEVLRDCADKIDNGVFAHLEPMPASKAH